MRKILGIVCDNCKRFVIPESAAIKKPTPWIEELHFCGRACQADYSKKSTTKPDPMTKAMLEDGLAGRKAEVFE